MANFPSFTNTTDDPGLLQAFAHLFRLPMGIPAALAACATVYALDATTPLWEYGLTATILICTASAACAINDYWDVDKDRIDHPDRPLPSGQISLQQAWWAALILFGCALISAIPLGIYPFILVLVGAIVLWNYSHLLPYSGILGNLAVATIGSALIFLGSLVANRPFAMLYPAWFLFFYALAKEIIWDIHDTEGDRTEGISTIANRWGDRIAFGMVWGLLGVLLGSIPIAFRLLPMAHPITFAVFSLAVVLTLGIALVRFQQQRSEVAYNQFIFWERISTLLGVLALLATAPPP
jgi:geranylgeranylglycerol-phosphate geranylgeranyltransferase